MAIARSWLHILAAKRSILVGLGLLGVLSVAGAFAVGGTSSISNIRSMLLLAAFLGLASLGQTMCALLGGLDLSIPYIIGAANILLAALLGSGMPAGGAILLLLAAAAAIGILNGLLTLRIQGQSLIMTLGMGSAVAGGAQTRRQQWRH